MEQVISELAIKIANLEIENAQLRVKIKELTNAKEGEKKDD